MNIFVTHMSPVLAARNLDNLRLNKMVVETAQLLCTAHHLKKGSRAKVIYKPTHQNHPCAVWVRESFGNYNWAYRHFAALAAEFESRNGKVHKTWADLKDVLEKVPKGITNVARTPFPNCTPHKDMELIEAYRLTMTEKWQADVEAGRTPKWGERLTPPF
ncbi:pyrimidine dimer DNA glycosylase/endonuclease [Xanthomonas phage BUDD]|nr:pyrimidine dimer DNA glycosylase/endonuclease [Xanthomonas phage BUDD]